MNDDKEKTVVAGKISIPDGFSPDHLEKALSELKNLPKTSSGKVNELFMGWSHVLDGFEIKLYQKLSEDLKATLTCLKENGAKWALKQIESMKLSNFSHMDMTCVANESLLFTDSTANISRGELHQDSHKYEWFVLLCLSNNAAPFSFCDETKLERSNVYEFIHQANVDEDTISLLNCMPLLGVCKNLFRPKKSLLESFISFSSKMNPGDIFLVRGDVIHSTAACEGYRCLMFFTISAPNTLHRYNAGDQYTSTSVCFETLRAIVDLNCDEQLQRQMATKFIQIVQDNKENEPWKRFLSDKKNAGCIKSIADKNIDVDTLLSFLRKKK